jgi:plasmid stability protein
MFRCMHRTNIYLTAEQRTELAARAAAEGISVAELVRRLLDQALLGASEDLGEDLAAIDVSFGALREVDIDIDRTDGERGAHLERINRL